VIDVMNAALKVVFVDPGGGRSEGLWLFTSGALLPWPGASGSDEQPDGAAPALELVS
jgi:hypothetical protein